jgi:hypothetical protein
MRLGLLALPLLALPLACSFASQGEPEVGGDDEVANSASETDAEGSDDESDDEFGTDQGTSSDSTDGETTTDTTTDDDPSDTTETTTDTTEDTAEDTTEDTTEDTAEDTTDTGMNEPYYGACPSESADECQPGEVCKNDVDIGDTWTVCALSCDNSDQCPNAGGLPLICIAYFFQSKACHIDCESVACPDGMTCKSVNAGADRICAYQG